MRTQIKLAFDPAKPGEAVLELDGQDLLATGGEITRVTYDTDGIETTLTLRLGHVAAEIEGAADVVVHEEDQVLLQRLGWTPPAEAS